MRVLIACEFSGTVRDAFTAAGHYAMSCDLLPTESPGPHYQGNVLDVLNEGWDMLIAHPPCTYLCSSGLHWNKRVPGRAALTTEALAFVRQLWECDIPRICIENPVGCISTLITPSSQLIQPWQFGHDASKATCLWLRNLPPLMSTHYTSGRMIYEPISRKMRMRYANQTDSGQNRLTPGPDRWALRSLTFPGIAAAMAAQWGDPERLARMTTQQTLQFS